METINAPGTPQFNARPALLTVLCILTFIFSGWSILSGANQFFNAEKQSAIAAESMEKARERMGDNGPSFVTKIFDSVSAHSSPQTLREVGIETIIHALFTLLGAILMWQQKRNGFYIYIAGIVLGVVGTLLIYGSDGIGGITTGFMAAIGIVFILLYGSNLKYMNR